MNGRRMAAAALTVLVVISSGAAAMAKVNGVGQTHKGATLGMTAKRDLTGELTYHRADGTLRIHCKRFSSYQRSKSPAGFARVVVTARKCWQQDGLQRFLRAVFVDRGEPGNGRDIVRLWWGLRWPVRPTSVPPKRRDRGRIQSGNVQILHESVSG
jgi:hypothetical protein